MDEISLVVLGDPAEAALKGLSALGPDVRVTISKTAAGFGDELQKARVLFNWSGAKAEIQQSVTGGKSLEWFHTRSAGLDTLLFPDLINSPLPLTNGRGTFSQSLGEFVIAGALYFAKDLPRMLRSKADKKWDVFNVQELSKQTMGIVAHGDIGRAVARRAKAFGMRVLATRRDLTPRAGDENVDKLYPSSELHAMLPECDYVVSTAPLTPETKQMLGAAQFNLMKSSAVVMNVGRGPVIDEAALIEALRSKRIKGAVLDVFEVEPLSPESPLWSLDNVLISAHTADHTADWLQDAVNFFTARHRPTRCCSWRCS